MKNERRGTLAGRWLDATQDGRWKDTERGAIEAVNSLPYAAPGYLIAQRWAYDLERSLKAPYYVGYV